MFKVHGIDKRNNKRVERKFSTMVMRDQLARLWDGNPNMSAIGKENPATMAS